MSRPVAVALPPARLETAAEALARAASYLASREVPEPEANAEILLGAALGRGRLAARALGAGRSLGQKEALRFWQLIRERGRRIPLAYVLGSQPFMDLDIRVAPSVLIPRPETEGLVEAALELARARFPQAPVHILEIGTGSGCVSIALARRLPQATLYATEISPAALRVAEENAFRHGVAERLRLIRENLFKPREEVSAWADMLVSNPPYIPSAEIPELAAELHHEPALALDGGPDGLGAIRAIVAAAPGQLKAGGWLLLEIGQGQAAAAASLLEERFVSIQLRADLQGVPRVLLAQVRSGPK